MPDWPGSDNGGEAIAKVILDVGTGVRKFDEGEDGAVQLRNAVLFG